jgi:hypothetical protein
MANSCALRSQLGASLVKKNPQIDLYLQVGCGRCPLGGTPECKVHYWPEELKLLRTIVLECGLQG